MSQEERLQVLVVDDNTPDVILIGESLSEKGLNHAITHCSDGKQAIEVLRDAAPGQWQVIVLDLNMPKIDGLQVLQTLRQTPGFERLPVLVLTSSLAPEEQAEALRLGADRFLRKPADLDQFLITVGDAVSELVLDGRAH